jgi:hypothetical protein
MNLRQTLLVCAALTAVAHAQAPTICVPPTRGVQGGSPPGIGPDWYTANQGTPTGATPTFSVALDDPRWVGATAIDYPDAINSAPGDFRASVKDEGGGVKSLYLSWRIQGVPSAFGGDVVYIAWAKGAPSAATAGTLAQLRVANTVAATGNDQFGVLTPTFFDLPSGTKNTTLTPPWAVNNLAAPNDSTTTRVWSQDGTNAWGLEAKIPLTVGTDTDASGVFSFYYEIQSRMTQAGPILASYRWPRDQAMAGNATAPVAPPLANFGEFHLNPGCTSGVSITQIGTTVSGADSNKILPPPTANVFFARPHNATGAQIAAGGVHARFRLAQWGAQFSDNPQWTDIPGGSDITGAAIPDTTDGNLTFSWTLDAQANCDYFNNCGALTRTVRNPDQCLQVELSGPGLVFINQSVATNMDFAVSSKFTKDAVIDLRRLSPATGPVQDVYLYLQTVNMPADVAGAATPVPPPGKPVDADVKAALSKLSFGSDRPPVDPRTLPVADRRTLLQNAVWNHQTALEVGGHTYPLEQLGMPTYRVYVYATNGKTIQDGAQKLEVVEPLQGFGYYVSHGGPLTGWTASLAAEHAIPLGNNVYKIARVSSPVTTTTTVEALETSQVAPPKGTQWWLLVLIAVILIIVFIVVMFLRRKP